MMLTDTEIFFLVAHNIDASDVFDGIGMKRAQIKDAMNKTLQFFYIGSRCNRAGHRLRSGAGHCIQCNPAVIAYYLRYYQNGYLYIAGSSSTSQIKIGVTRNLSVRISSLNKSFYAGIRDWNLKYFLHSAYAGIIEQKIHKSLSGYRVEATYEHHGHVQLCREVFSCDVKTAIGTIEKISAAL